MSGTGDADLDDGSSSFDFIDNETAAFGDQNGCDETTDTPSNGVVTGEPEICHIDGGQADSTLIITPAGETLLMDTGDWRPDGKEVIPYAEAHDVDLIDHS